MLGRGPVIFASESAEGFMPDFVMLREKTEDGSAALAARLSDFREMRAFVRDGVREHNHDLVGHAFAAV
jgi:hypothetical protein